MELWIRSQDKRALVNVRQIRINGLDIMCFGGEILGTYKNEERALEVLDEIRDLIRVKYTFETDFKTAASTLPLEHAIKVLEQITVYEMPKE